MVMSKMARLSVFLMTLGCAMAPLPTWAALKAYVDRNPVVEDESFILTLESNGDADGSPDLAPLRRDFDVEGRSRSSSFTIINGSTSRSNQWRIQLMAKHSGKLKIPSISLGGEHSPPLTLTVTPASQAPASAGGGDVFLDVSVKPRTAYVQQQIIYTVRLFSAVDLAKSSSLSEPTPSGDAVVEKLGKDRNYETVRNGVRYDVIERSYALYPQKSGDLSIPPLVFKGDVVQGGGGGFFAFGPFNQRVHHKRLRSEPEHVVVKTVPAAFHGRQWLPARNLQLVETWSPDPPNFTVGKAVTHTVAVMADGLTASQLPSLAGTAVSGLKQYPDQPSLKDTPGSDGVTGLRTEKIAYIPEQAGKVTLPAIEIPWWNTTDDRMEVARLPARTYTVRAAPTAGVAAAPTVPAANAAAQRASPVSVSRPSETQPQPTPQPGSDRWAWVALLLGFGWLATLAGWWWQARRISGRSVPEKSVEQESLHRLEKSLQACCSANDAAGAKAAVLAWSRRHWPEHPPLSLTAVAHRCQSSLSESLLELDRALYSEMESMWQGRMLWQRFAAFLDKKERKAGKQDTVLEPLYRDSGNLGMSN